MSSTPENPLDPEILSGSDRETICRVCGYEDGSSFWEGGWPDESNICPCCDHEPNVGDASVMSLRNYRGYWLGQGAVWSRPKLRPKGWDLLEQVKKIPTEWR